MFLLALTCLLRPAPVFNVTQKAALYGSEQGKSGLKWERRQEPSPGKTMKANLLWHWVRHLWEADFRIPAGFKTS